MCVASQSLGMPKSKVGGSLVSVLMFQQYTGGFIGPLAGSAVNAAVGFQGFTLLVAVFLAVIYAPCAIAMKPYGSVGTCFKKKEPEAASEGKG